MPVPVRDYLRMNNQDVLQQMERDPNLAPLLDCPMPRPDDDLAQNLSLIGLIHNNAPGSFEQIPRAASFFSSVMARSLNLRNIADANVPRRPTEEGLPHALITMADCRERFRSTKLASLNMDPAAMRFKVNRINVLRATLLPIISITRGMNRNLAVEEHAAKTEMKEDFDMVRSMVHADIDLAPLETVDDYLYGSAAKGAETRRDNRRTFEDMTAKAEKDGLAAATRKARSTVTQEFAGLVQDLLRTDPSADDENRNTPR